MLLSFMQVNIHPKWLIDDRAIIFRKSVWLMAVIFATMEAINAIMILKSMYDKIVKGAIFCQVIRVKQEYHSTFFITNTNQ